MAKCPETNDRLFRRLFCFSVGVAVLPFCLRARSTSGGTMGKTRHSSTRFQPERRTTAGDGGVLRTRYGSVSVRDTFCLSSKRGLPLLSLSPLVLPPGRFRNFRNTKRLDNCRWSFRPNARETLELEREKGRTPIRETVKGLPNILPKDITHADLGQCVSISAEKFTSWNVSQLIFRYHRHSVRFQPA